MCPCGSGQSYDQCCGMLHCGLPATSPEQLMRSRYTAFVRGDAAYLHRTHAPTTRPEHYDLDPSIRFFALEVHRAYDNIVEFSAHYLTTSPTTHTTTPSVLRERSRFEKLNGQWHYVEGSPITAR